MEKSRRSWTNDTSAWVAGWSCPTLGSFGRPIRVLFFMVSNSAPCTGRKPRHSLTDPSGGAYHGLWAPLLIFELLVNLTLMSFPVFLIILFFQRRRTFPPLFVMFLLFSVIASHARPFWISNDPCVARQNSSSASLRTGPILHGMRHLDTLYAGFKTGKGDICSLNAPIFFGEMPEAGPLIILATTRAVARRQVPAKNSPVRPGGPQKSSTQWRTRSGRRWH